MNQVDSLSKKKKRTHRCVLETLSGQLQLAISAKDDARRYRIFSEVLVRAVSLSYSYIGNVTA